MPLKPHIAWLKVLLALILIAVSCSCERNSSKTISAKESGQTVRWGSRIAYQVLVDRFFDGDPKNNTAKVQKSNPLYYQGGDLEGLRQKLPGLKDLGVSLLILNPISNSTSYHGYDVLDLREINPQLGTFSDLKALTSDAHSLGILVILDLVVNHAGPESPLPIQWFRRGASSDALNDRFRWERRTSMSIFNLREYALESGEVYAYLWSAAKQFADQGIDGFAFDSMQLVEPWFWKKFIKDIKQYAGRDFLTIGAGYSPLQSVLQPYSPHFDAILDFRHHQALRNVVERDVSSNEILFALDQRKLFRKELLHFNFLDHDSLPRLTSIVPGAFHREKMEQALVLLFSQPGIPLLLYGEEFGLKNDKRLTHVPFSVGRTPMIFEKSPSDDYSHLIRRLSDLRGLFNFSSEDREDMGGNMTSPFLLTILRDVSGTLLAIHNVSPEGRTAVVNLENITDMRGQIVVDALTGEEFQVIDTIFRLAMRPYQSRLLVTRQNYQKLSKIIDPIPSVDKPKTKVAPKSK